MPPLYGILINTDVGNPIVPVSMFSRLKANPKRLRGGLLVFNLLYKETRALLLFSILSEFARRLEFQQPRL